MEGALCALHMYFIHYNKSIGKENIIDKLSLIYYNFTWLHFFFFLWSHIPLETRITHWGKDHGLVGVKNQLGHLFIYWYSESKSPNLVTEPSKDKRTVPIGP